MTLQGAELLLNSNTVPGPQHHF